jgi:hypothetical protein
MKGLGLCSCVSAGYVPEEGVSGGEEQVSEGEGGGGGEAVVEERVYVCAELLTPMPYAWRQYRGDARGAGPLSQLHLFGTHPDVESRWLDAMTAADREVWYSPLPPVSATTSDLRRAAPGAPDAPLTGDWLSGAVIDVAMAFAMYCAPSPDVVYMPYTMLMSATHVQDGVEWEAARDLLLSFDVASRTGRRRPPKWLATFTNTDPGTGSHWQLLLYHREQGVMFQYDPFERVTAQLQSGLRDFFAAHGRLSDVRPIGLGVQHNMNASECGCHVVAAFYDWLRGGSMSDVRQRLDDNVSRDVVLCLLKWAVYQKWLSTQQGMDVEDWDKLQAETKARGARFKKERKV